MCVCNLELVLNARALLWILEMIECLHAPSLLLKIAHLHTRTQWLRVDLDTQLNVKCTTPKKRIEKKWRMSERKTKKELRKREILNALMRCSPLAHEQQALMFKLVSSAQNTQSELNKKNRYQMRKNGLESAYNSKCNTNQQYSAM